MGWERAERVQKNSSGEYRAFIGGKWTRVSKAQKNEKGEYRVMLDASASQPKLTSSELAMPEGVPTGIAETAATLGTGAIGTVAGGLAGIAQGAKNLVSPGIPAADRVRQVQDALTYEPESNVGKKLTGAIAYPFEKLAQGAGAAGNKVLEFTGSPEAATAVDTAIQMVVPYGLAKGASAIKTVGSKNVALAEELKKQKQPLTDTMQEVRDAGFVMPPAMTNPSIPNKLFESIGGKQATQQDASIRNQSAVNKVIRDELRAPSDMPINETSLRNLSEQRSQPYRDVADLPGQPPVSIYDGRPIPNANPSMVDVPPTPDKLLDALKKTRLESKLTWNEFKKSGSVDAYKKHDSLVRETDKIESALEDAASAAKKPELIAQLRAARKDIAQIHDVERAMNADRGEVSALDLAKARDKGVPMSGGLETAAKMGNTFPKAVQRPEIVGEPGVHALGPMLGGGLGGGLGAVLGGGTGAAGGAAAGSLLGMVGTPYVQMLVRNMMLSKPYQNAMGTPDYGASMLSRAASKLPEEEILRALIQSQQGQER